MKLREIVDWMNGELRVGEIEDYPNAHNGLQLENTSGEVTRVACAVDGCEAVIEMAVEAGADLLIVHHGMMWGGAQRLEGAPFRKIRAAIEGGLAVYSCHLPLDQHPTLGNNAILAREIGMEETEPFAKYGLRAYLDIGLVDLIDKVERVVGGPVHLAPGGPDRVRRIGVVTGGGGNLIAEVAAEGIDTFVTGEGAQHTYTLAEELGVNLIYAGHYATETFGTKALAAAVSDRFEVPWEFLDHPTGL